ncbi:unnamed protein product [Caretta caretta]
MIGTDLQHQVFVRLRWHWTRITRLHHWIPGTRPKPLSSGCGRDISTTGPVPGWGNIPRSVHFESTVDQMGIVDQDSEEAASAAAGLLWTMLSRNRRLFNNDDKNS